MPCPPAFSLAPAPLPALSLAPAPPAPLPAPALSLTPLPPCPLTRFGRRRHGGVRGARQDRPRRVRRCVQGGPPAVRRAGPRSRRAPQPWMHPAHASPAASPSSHAPTARASRWPSSEWSATMRTGRPASTCPRSRHVAVWPVAWWSGPCRPAHPAHLHSLPIAVHVLCIWCRSCKRCTTHT